MQEVRQNKENDTLTALRAYYLADPLVRFMANSPLRAALIAHFIGFWSLVFANWLNSSILWSSVRSCDIVFLNSPFDWLYIGILLPMAFWVLARYYRDLLNGIEKLADEGIVRPEVVRRIVHDRKNSSLVRGVHWVIRYTLPLVFAGFLWSQLPTWAPKDKTAWFMSHDRTTANSVGILLMFLAVVEALIAFGYLIDTIRFAWFHLALTRQKDEQSDSSLMSFYPKHPDGAFGYGPLASSMNWAGILGILALLMVLIGLANAMAVKMKDAVVEALFDPTLLVNLVFCLIFFPWIVFGPVWPFMAILFRRKKEYMCSLREQFLKKDGATAINTAGTDIILTGWETIAKSRPYILERKSAFIILGVVLSTYLVKIFDQLLSLTRANLSW
jgi:hypothetical protein